MKYELYEVSTGDSYGVYDTYEEAYEQKIEINHRLHLVCGGDYYVDLDIREINK